MNKYTFRDLLVSVLSVLFPALLQAQPVLPTESIVTMGHLHYEVASPEREKEFWLGLGAQEFELDDMTGVSFPGLIILLSQNEAEVGSAGSLVDHVAFRVASIEAIERSGFELEYNQQFPGIAVLYTPSGGKVELFDDRLATNIGFDQDAGYDDPVAERHNLPLTAAIVTHHLHFYLPPGQALVARDWYVDHFKAIPGQRWRYSAADLPGMNLNFSELDSAQAGTEGHTLNHIGFEVSGLEAFCEALAASGISFDVPYKKQPSGMGIAILTDPWGTKIELTEGL